MKPWMPQNQIDLIQSYLKPTDTMLEYGAGGSTLYFSQYVEKYVSIEHDINWIDKIRENKMPDNVELHYCAPNNKIQLPTWEGNPEDFQNYISFIDTLTYKNYDKVFIDGRVRVKCSVKVLDYLNTDSLVFVHDFFERDRYHKILEYYKIIDQDRNTRPSLVILKKHE
jgi:hypothetical protein